MIERDDARLHLCAITDDLRDGTAGLVARALAAQRGGATMVLLWLKHADARTLVEVGSALVAALTVPLVVSERLDVALACGAAGVHLTSASMPVVAVRMQVPSTFLIGGSVSRAEDLEHAQAADYVTVGPVFGAGEGSLGLEGFRRLVQACGRPALAIGGVDASVVAALREAGASGVAVIRAVLGAEDPAAAAAALVVARGAAEAGGGNDAAPDHVL
jgi:thiamine-phosphate pyrophosphorylase